MSEDRYEIINPWAVKWHGPVLHILEKENDPSFRVLDSEVWDIEFIIKAHKLEPIKAGQGWWDDRVDNFETESIEILGLIERDSVTYVAYMDYEGATYLSDESYFRSNFHRNLSE